MQNDNDNDDLAKISFYKNTNKDTMFQGVYGTYKDAPTFSIVVAGLSGEEAAQFIFHFTNDMESAIRQYSIYISPSDMDKYSHTPYRGEPMSVGDLVAVDAEYDVQEYLCLSQGWKKL